MMADPTPDSTGCSLLEPFALQVLGEEMAPELPDRCIVIVEPTDQRRNGTYVVADVEGVRWLRKYVKDNTGGERLIAENRIFPDIELNGLEWRVLGVVTQRNIRRKIKHYDYSREPETAPVVEIRDLTGR
jgi:SOS-response transcriptional repressor LexA